MGIWLHSARRSYPAHSIKPWEEGYHEMLEDISDLEVNYFVLLKIRIMSCSSGNTVVEDIHCVK